MPPVYLEKVLRHAERELVHQSHLRPTDMLDIYRRFLKLEEHRLKLEHKHGEGGRDLCKKRADVISVMLRHLGTARGKRTCVPIWKNLRASPCWLWAALAG